ncbi:unnamed protein product, partial [marine sediment metagenome]
MHNPIEAERGGIRIIYVNWRGVFATTEPIENIC